MNSRTFNVSNIVGILSLLATVCTVGATALNLVAPHYAVVALALAAGINAFTGRVQGTPPDVLEK